ncbi:unnamed protein product [Closterium sp. NIES-53]
MDAEMASWKSTSTYVDAVPPPGANIVSGMWIFRGVDYFQTFSPTPKMTSLRVLLHVAAHRDYELHSLDFSTAFLQGSLHEEIWLSRPPGFTGTTLAALGFAPSTADPSLFLRTDTSLPPFYILVYVDDLVFATADTAGLAYVKSELQKRHTCTDLGELRSYLGLQITRDRARSTITLTQSHMVQQVLQRFGLTYSSPQATPLPTRHSLSALPSDESVESSGPYPELVGCLMYLMTCTRPDLAYPLSILACYVAPGRHRPEHMAAAKRVLRYLCSTSGMGLVLGGRSPVVLTGHADASWADDQATQRSSQGYTFSLGSGSVSWRATRSSSVLGSSCEAEIYAGAMAAQELRWLTYLLTDLREPPRSPPVLYVDNKAMLALCREQRLEHRTKHIALRYFLARELQQRGQLWLAYVASEANTADVFTKALAPCDHQRFCTQLACFALLCLTGLVTPCSPPLCLWGGRRRPDKGKGGRGGGGGGGGGSGGGGGGGGRGGGGGGVGSSSGGGGGGGGGGSGGGGGGSGGAGRGSTQRSGSGGGPRQEQQRSRETPSSHQLREWYAGRQRGGGAGPCTYVLRTGDRVGEQCGGLHSTQRCFGRLTDSWRHQFPGTTEIPRWGDLDEGDCYLCLPPDPGGGAAALGACEAAALGASASAAPGAGESALSGTASAQVFHTITLDSGASRSFFRDRTTLTPLNRPVAVSLADPSEGPVLASFSTVLPCPAAPSGTLLGLYLPSFSTNLVSGADLQDQGVDQFTPASQRVTHCTCARTGRHLATFTRRPRSSLYTLSTESPPVPPSGQVAASSRVLATTSGPGMASRVLVSGLPKSLPPLPSGPTPTCVPCAGPAPSIAPREWHDTLRTTLAALGFAPSTADPSLFLRTDNSLPPFAILVYVDDLVFATADTAGLAHVKSELQKRHTCTDLGELRSYLGLQITRDRAQRTITLTQSHMVQQVLQCFGFTYSSPQATALPTRHSLSALPSDESVEPSGPYPELVGCLMYLMTCTRPDLAYPLSILARYVAPGRHRPEHMAAAKRVLRTCAATQRSSQGYTFSLGSGSVSWRSTRSSSVLGSSCEAEIYAGAMAAQELHWLTYLLTHLGEPPRSPPVLYVDNKAMLALCREHRLEHRTKHIALRYFLAGELQQRGQLRLAYVASQANTADVFTKALPPGDHQRFCTMLACFALLDWSCDLLFS